MPISSTNNNSTHRGILPASYFILHGTDSPRLLGGRCNACGETSFPKAEVCPSCLSEDISSIALSMQGRLYSYTVLHLGRSGDILPYAVGYVDLPEGIRLFSHLTVTKNLRPDMQVECFISKIDGDNSEEKHFDVGFGPVMGNPNHA